MLRILFPTDYSDTANNAFVYALQMCKNYNGELLILHVYAPNLPTTHLSENKILDAFDLFQSKVKDMRALALKEDLNNVPMQFALEEGELVQNIQNLCDNEQIDIVIMGTTGNAGFENKVLGSKTVSVIKNISLPIISVPYLAKFKGIDTIGFTTIYDEKDQVALQRMIPYVKNSKSDIICLHVKTKAPEKTNEEKKQFKEHFKTEPIYFVEKENNDLVKAVFEFIDEHSLDIISCVTREVTFFEALFNNSVSEKLSYHKYVPFLTYNETMLK